MSRRFYHTIPRRALGGNETTLLECLISHARCLFLEAQDSLQARQKILMRQKNSSVSQLIAVLWNLNPPFSWTTILEKRYKNFKTEHLSEHYLPKGSLVFMYSSGLQCLRHISESVRPT